MAVGCRSAAPNHVDDAAAAPIDHTERSLSPGEALCACRALGQLRSLSSS